MAMHILSVKDFDAAFLRKVCELAQVYKDAIKSRSLIVVRKTRGIILLFYQPSTRTRTSFEIAARLIGMPVLTVLDAAEITTSAAKGESVGNTIENLCYDGVGIIVIRNKESGSATEAARAADKYGVSIINGGSGTEGHPTQTLLDCFTMLHLRKVKKVSDINLVLAGDISHSRVFNSLAILFARCFDPKKIGICAPNGIDLPEDVRASVQNHGVEIIRFESIPEALRWSHFFYVSRPQIEFHPNPEYSQLFEGFQITKDLLDDLPEDNPCMLLHAQPISSHYLEITPEAQDHPRCVIMAQKNNGLYVRMALLELVNDALNHPSA